MHLNLMHQAWVQQTCAFAAQGTLRRHIVAQQTWKHIVAQESLNASSRSKVEAVACCFHLPPSKPISMPPLVLGCVARGVALSWPCLGGRAAGRDMMRRNMMSYHHPMTHDAIASSVDTIAPCVIC